MPAPSFSDSVGQFRSVAAELLAEWRIEIARVVRGLLASSWARGGAVVVLEIESEQVRIKLLADGQTQEIGSASSPGASRAGEISALLAASELVPRGTADVIVELPSSDVLRRQFELPAARRATLARAVPFELERLSPIEADKLYYDFTILETGRSKKQSDLELRIVKRSAVDSAVALAHAAGLRVGAIRFAGDPREASWRAVPIDRGAWLRIKWRQWNVFALFALALVLGAAVIFAAYMRGAAAADALSDAVDGAATRAAIIHRLNHQISDVRAQIEFPLAQKRAPFLLESLAEVTRVLPEGTWLTEFEFDAGKVHIQGFAKSASDVVGEIDRSPMFANAQFMAPLQSAQNGNERFDLSFDVKAPRRR